MLLPRFQRPVAIFSLLLAMTAACGQDTQPSTAPQIHEFAYVLMATSMGDIVIELNRAKAPITVANFLSYTDKEFFDDTVFHRVMSNFMIQGGGFTAGMTKKPTDPGIENEWRNGLKNKRGSIAMARLGGQPESATSQFFINVKDNAGLDSAQPDGAGYAVFGRVVAGMNVVDKIRYVDTGVKMGRQNVPIETIVIETVRQITPEDAKKKIAQTPTTKPGG